MSDLILKSPGRNVATMTLSRPDRLNALNGRLAEELLGTIRQIDTDPAVRCLVLTGTWR